jgi:predicted negative regulator of RcsB-dependent stress response
MLEKFSFTDFKSQLKTNKNLKLTTYFIGGVLGIMVLYIAYRQFIWSPSNEKSKEAYFKGLNLAAKDSTDAAINELEPVVKKFDGKQGGEVAQFVLARQYMAKGDFKKALEELEDVDVNDTYVSVYKIGLQGDCQSELGKYKEALELYLEAAELNENEHTTPTYLFKAALVAEEMKNFEEASELYTRIKSNYLNFSNAKSIDKYIARAKNNTVK